MNEFTFSIADVLDCLHVSHPGLGSGDSKYIDCPLCGGKKKLHIVYSKNLALCMKCSKGGGMLKFASAMLGTSDNSAAYRKIMEMIGGQSEEYRYIQKETYKKQKEKADKQKEYAAKLASVNERDRTYKAFLKLLSLAPEHEENLKNRGLNDEQIKEYGFKSVPAFGKFNIPDILAREGVTLIGVPPFYQENGRIAINLGNKSGFYIPVKNLYGQIIGLQVRMDVVEEKGCRYIWVASWFDNFFMYKGSSLSGVPKFHHVGFENGLKEKNIPAIAITEGPLKGDIAYELLRYKIPIIALCGLGNQMGMYEEIEILQKEYGLKKVVDLTDQDKFDFRIVKPSWKNHAKVIYKSFKNCSRIFGKKSEEAEFVKKSRREILSIILSGDTEENVVCNVKKIANQLVFMCRKVGRNEKELYTALSTLLNEIAEMASENQVRRHCDHIFSELERRGIEVERFKWDRTYKGIDDYLAAICKKK